MDNNTLSHNIRCGPQPYQYNSKHLEPKKYLLYQLFIKSPRLTNFGMRSPKTPKNQIKWNKT